MRSDDIDTHTKKIFMFRNRFQILQILTYIKLIT